MADTNDIPEAQSLVRCDGILGGPEAWCEARNTMPQPERGASSGGRWTAGREAVKRSGTGEPPPGWPCGVRWPEDASDNEPHMRQARELPRPEGTCDCDGNAAGGVPRGNIRGREEPSLQGGTRTGCSITPCTSHVPAGPAARVTAASGMFGGAERRFGRKLHRGPRGVC